MSEPIVYNPFAYEIHEDPYPTYARMREEEPTYWNPEMGFWALSRFEDVLNGYRDWERFTSTQGIALGESGNISAPSMIGMDPPVQTKLRKLIVRAFTPKRMAAMEPRIRDLTTKFLDTFIEEGECDLIARFAALLPSDVISTLLGAPPEDHSNLRIWTAEMLTREDGVARPPPAAEQASANAQAVASAWLVDTALSRSDAFLWASGRLVSEVVRLESCFVAMEGAYMRDRILRVSVLVVVVFVAEIR